MVRKSVWIERFLLPGAADVTWGEGTTVSEHWGKHYKEHGLAPTVQEGLDLFHEDLMGTPFPLGQSPYRTTVGDAALAASLPHPLSHKLLFPQLKKASKKMPRNGSGIDWSMISDTGFGYGTQTSIATTGKAREGRLPAAISVTELPGFEFEGASQAVLDRTWTPATQMNQPVSIMAGIDTIGLPIGLEPRRRPSRRVSVGKNLPRLKTWKKLNRYMHDWNQQLRQMLGRGSGFTKSYGGFGSARPKRRRISRHRHKINSFEYQRGGRQIHSHKVKSRRRRY